MDQRNVVQRGPRRLGPRQRREGGRIQRRAHRTQPRGALGMAGSRVMREAGVVGQQQRRHGRLRAMSRPATVGQRPAAGKPRLARQRRRRAGEFGPGLAEPRYPHMFRV
jgi:hypothetical protein